MSPESAKELAKILEEDDYAAPRLTDGEPCLWYHYTGIPVRLINEIRATAGLPAVVYEAT